MTPHTDPCCHGAGAAASTRPRTATPLINHLGHRAVTGLCRLPVHVEAGPHLRGQQRRPGSGPSQLGSQACFWQGFPKLLGLKGRVGKSEDTF